MAAAAITPLKISATMRYSPTKLWNNGLAAREERTLVAIAPDERMAAPSKRSNRYQSGFSTMLAPANSFDVSCSYLDFFARGVFARAGMDFAGLPLRLLRSASIRSMTLVSFGGSTVTGRLPFSLSLISSRSAFS